MIKSLTGPYKALSNFYLCPILYEGILYPSVEHSFQAAKTFNLANRDKISKLKTCKEAKAAGGPKGFIKLRPDWEEVKIAIMDALLDIKFQDDKLATLLILTDDEEIQEGNTHGDKFWGTVKGEGRNELGKALMRKRDRLKLATV